MTPAVQAAEGHGRRVVARSNRCELEPDHVAAAANVADRLRIDLPQRLKPAEEVGAVRGDVADDLAVVALEHVERGAGHPAGEIVVGEGRAVQQPEAVVPDLGADDAGADRHHAAAERLGQQQHVRGLRRPAGDEELAGASEAGLDLVDDAEHAVPPAELDRRVEVAVRRADDAALALDRLDA